MRKKYFEFEKSFKFQTLHIRDFLRSEGVLGPKAELRLKDVNQYLKSRLRLSVDKPAKSKAHVVEVWEKYFFQLQTLQITAFLRAKGVLGLEDELTLETFNNYLKNKLKFADEYVAQSKLEVVRVWEKYSSQLRDLE